MPSSIKLVYYGTFRPVEAKHLEAWAAFLHFVLRSVCPSGTLVWPRFKYLLVALLARSPLSSPSSPPAKAGAARDPYFSTEKRPAGTQPWGLQVNMVSQEQKIWHNLFLWLSCCLPALPDTLTVASLLFPWIISHQLLGKWWPSKSAELSFPEGFSLKDAMMSLP